MKWSPAPSPTWPTHQAEQSTTRPCLLLASCTPTSSLPASETLEEMVGEGRSGLIPRATTGTWTAPLSSGHSCRKRRASWGTCPTLYCWPLMDTAGREFGARMCVEVMQHIHNCTRQSLFTGLGEFYCICVKSLSCLQRGETWTVLKEGLN